MAIEEKHIWKALGTVEDPDLHRDLVSLNMVKDLEVGEQEVGFTLVLTTPACPLKEKLRTDCEAAIHDVYPQAAITIEFDSVVTSQRANNFEQLKGIKHLIGVASGKGGVGKSTVAANLAVGLAREGAATGLLDADIHGPSLPTMFGLQNTQPEVIGEGDNLTMIPFQKYGVKVFSMGSLIDDTQPIVWRGPMISSALKQLLLDVDWGTLDYLIVDLPPGTGDIHLTLSQQFPLSAVVMVTTPQQVSLADTRRSIEMYRQPQIDIPVIGMVENMSYFTPKELPDHKYYLFGQGGGQKLAGLYGLPMLAELPLIAGVSEAADDGKPAAAFEDSLLRAPFQEMARRVAQQLAILHTQDRVQPA